jgi:hypothetical protein
MSLRGRQHEAISEIASLPAKLRSRPWLAMTFSEEVRYAICVCSFFPKPVGT